MNPRIHPIPVEEDATLDFVLTINGTPVPLYCARVSAHPLNQVWPGNIGQMRDAGRSLESTSGMPADMDQAVAASGGGEPPSLHAGAHRPAQRTRANTQRPASKGD